MNSFVPIWDMEDNYRSFHSLLPPANQRKSMRADQELLELVWQNGHVVMQNQSNRAGNCSEFKQASKPEAPPKCGGNFGSADTFIHEEEETAPWLQYPLDNDPLDGDLCSNLFYANEMFASDPNVPKETNRVHVEESAMPPPKPQSAAAAADGGGGVVNFSHFSRSKKVDTPCVSRRSGGKGIENGSQREVGESSSMGTKLSTNFSSSVSDAVPRQVEGVHAATLTSSSAGSGSSVGRTCPNTTSSQSRKRKGGDAEESECQSEETEFQSAEAAKAPQRQRSAASARRSRAAEVHNLSERRRRDRINEKMKALQNLIPHCNKTDKASMLDEAIEYLKSLQLQVQMMWMGNGMAPMMFPSPQHYLSLIGRGMSHGSTMPSAPSAVQMPRAPVANQSMSSATGTNQATLNPIHLLNQMQSSSVPDAYARYLGFHQMQQPPQGMSMFNPYGSQLIQTNHSAVTTETNHLPNNGNSPSDATQRGKTG